MTIPEVELYVGEYTEDRKKQIEIETNIVTAGIAKAFNGNR